MIKKLKLIDSFQEWISKFNQVIDLKLVDGNFPIEDISGSGSVKIKIGSGIVGVDGGIYEIDEKEFTLESFKSYKVYIESKNSSYTLSCSSTATDNSVVLYEFTTDSQGVVSLKDFRTWLDFRTRSVLDNPANLTFAGEFDASKGNLPSEPSTSSYWLVTTPGVIDSVRYKKDDLLFYSIKDGETFWTKVDNQENKVLSVNNKTGDVELTTDDVPEGETNLYYSDQERQRLDNVVEQSNRVYETRLESDVTEDQTVIEVMNGDIVPEEIDESTTLALYNKKNNQVEFVKVTSREGNNLTVTRGAEGTSATVFGVGDIAELYITAGTFAAQSLADRDRSNGTGTQAADTIIDPENFLVKNKYLSTYISTSDITASSLGLDETGSNADDVLDTFTNIANSNTKPIRFIVDRPMIITRGDRVITRSNVEIAFMSGCSIDMTGFNPVNEGFPFTFRGAGITGEITTLTQSVDVGHNNHISYSTLHVESTSNFAVGDYILINSVGEYFSGVEGVGGYRPVWQGCISEIREIVDSTSMTLVAALPVSFNAEDYTVNVRKAKFLSNINIIGAKVNGPNPEPVNESGTIGPGFVKLEYVTDFFSDRCDFSSLNGAPIHSNIGLRQIVSNAVAKNVFTLWRCYGVEQATFFNPRFNGGRRPTDLDASEYGTIDDSDGNISSTVVHTRDFEFIGGYTEDAFTGPGGHMYQGLTVIGHRVRNASAGIQHRGKDLTVVGCDIRGYRGILLGVGSTQVDDPSLYSEDPSCGHVSIDASTTIRAFYAGVYATTSWESLLLEARIEAVQAFVAVCKRQDNAIIKPNFKWIPGYNNGGNSLPAFDFKYPHKTSCSNISIQGGVILGPYIGIKNEGAKNPIRNFTVENVKFIDVIHQLVRVEGDSSVWPDRANNLVNNCSKDGPKLTGSEVSGFSSSGFPFLDPINNTWGSGLDRNIISNGKISIKTRKVNSICALQGGDSPTVTGIEDGVRGQIITFRAETGTITFSASSSLKMSTELFDLFGWNTITFASVYDSGSYWVEVSRSTNQ